MQSLAVPATFQSLLECTSVEMCPHLRTEEEGPTNLQEIENEYSGGEISEMRISNIILGSIWWLEAYLPIIMWYALRRTGIRAMKDTNAWYYRAWNYMWMSHYFIYQLSAIVFPFTFFGSTVVNDFYILINYWISTVVGGGNTLVVFILFLMGMSSYTQVDGGMA